MWHIKGDVDKLKRVSFGNACTLKTRLFSCVTKIYIWTRNFHSTQLSTTYASVRLILFFPSLLSSSSRSASFLPLSQIRRCQRRRPRPRLHFLLPLLTRSVRTPRSAPHAQPPLTARSRLLVPKCLPSPHWRSLVRAKGGHGPCLCKFYT